MVASIPCRQGGMAPVDMATHAASARPGVPQGKVSAVTATRLRRAKKKNTGEVRASEAAAAAANGLRFAEELLLVNHVKVRPVPGTAARGAGVGLKFGQ